MGRTIAAITELVGPCVVLEDAIASACHSFLYFRDRPLRVDGMPFGFKVDGTFNEGKVVVLVFPCTRLQAVRAILPCAMEAIACPALTRRFVFQVVGRRPRRVRCATRIMYGICDDNAIEDSDPCDLVGASRFMIDNGRCIVTFFARNGTYGAANVVGYDMLNFLLFDLFIVVIVGLVREAIQALNNGRAKAVYRASSATSGLCPLRLSIFLEGDGYASSNVGHRYVNDFFVEELISNEGLLRSNGIIRFVAPHGRVVPLLVHCYRRRDVNPLSDHEGDRYAHAIDEGIKAIRLSLFRRFRSPLVNCEERLRVFVDRATYVHVRRVMAILCFRFTIGLAIGTVNRSLGEAPRLLSNGMATLFFIVQACGTVNSVVTTIIGRSVRVRALRTLVDRCPGRASNAAKVLARRFPVVVRSNSISSVMRSVRGLNQRGCFQRARVILTFSMEAVIRNFVSARITLQVGRQAFLEVVFVRFAVRFDVPTFFVAVTPPSGAQVICVANGRFFCRLLPISNFILTVPTTWLVRCVGPRQIADFGGFKVNEVVARTSNVRIRTLSRRCVFGILYLTRYASTFEARAVAIRPFGRRAPAISVRSIAFAYFGNARAGFLVFGVRYFTYFVGRNGNDLVRNQDFDHPWFEEFCDRVGQDVITAYASVQDVFNRFFPFDVYCSDVCPDAFCYRVRGAVNVRVPVHLHVCYRAVCVLDQFHRSGREARGASRVPVVDATFYRVGPYVHAFLTCDCFGCVLFFQSRGCPIARVVGGTMGDSLVRKTNFAAICLCLHVDRETFGCRLCLFAVPFNERLGFVFVRALFIDCSFEGDLAVRFRTVLVDARSLRFPAEECSSFHPFSKVVAANARRVPLCRVVATAS